MPNNFHDIRHSVFSLGLPVIDVHGEFQVSLIGPVSWLREQVFGEVFCHVPELKQM